MAGRNGGVVELLAGAYGALGLAVPDVVWCADPADFGRKLGAIRFSEAVHGDAFVPPEGDDCVCPACLGIDITDRIESVLDGLSEREHGHVLLEAVRMLEPAAAGPLEVRAHPIGCLFPSQRLAWGVRSPSTVPMFLDDVSDAWAFTRSTAVLLRRGNWRTDDEGRLHDSVDGPALDWGHWQVPFHHGVMLPAWAVDPWEIDVDRILGERNGEVRRCLAERYGMDRFVVDNPAARLVDHDKSRGQLWDLSIDRWGRSERMVRVTDATPTRSGDRKVYWLRVPPDMRTAHEAVAWTFGLDSHEYQPEVET